MEIKEIPYDEEIICPFCQKVIVDKEDNDPETCSHTIFIATDYGWEYQAEEYKAILDEYDSDKHSSYDEFTSSLKIEGLVKYAHYVPAPSFFGAYIGFKE